jgi:capsid portal protein
VESRRFTRDEILAIFKVPKSVIGITDDVNRASALTAERTFYKSCIEPISKLIQETINKEIFYNEVYFRFVNVVPADNEQYLLDLNN